MQGDTNASLAGRDRGQCAGDPTGSRGGRSTKLRSPHARRAQPGAHRPSRRSACARRPSVAEQNLRAEGIPNDRIHVTGNTVVEAVLELLPSPEQRHDALAQHAVEPGGFVLATFHRPENVDDRVRFATILDQLASLPLPVVLPLHPRSAARARDFDLADKLETRFGSSSRSATRSSSASGPNPLFSSPIRAVSRRRSRSTRRSVIVVRRSTERPEVLGTFAELVEPDAIGAAAQDPGSQTSRACMHAWPSLPSPYGDGSASELTVKAIGELVGNA